MPQRRGKGLLVSGASRDSLGFCKGPMTQFIRGSIGDKGFRKGALGIYRVEKRLEGSKGLKGPVIIRHLGLG